MAYGGNVKSLGYLKREKIYETIDIQDSCESISSVLFKDLPKQITVYQCHKDYLAKCPGGFAITAKSQQGIIEAIECPEKLRFGVQFHPENCEIGHRVLDNFVAFCNKMESLKNRLKLIK
jgi:anthranilate/para-aminobenzoate synthase component II